MDPSWLQPHGLRPTLRHLMILVAFAAILCGFAAPLLRPGTSTLDHVTASLALPFAPLALSLMVLVFDRTGLVKFWLTGMLASLFLPAFVAWFDVMAAVVWAGRAPVVMWPWIVVLNAIGLSVLVRVVRRYAPRRCVHCDRGAVLTTGEVRWCAACGLKQKPG